MKLFKVENKITGNSIKVTLYNPPYENKNVLHMTGLDKKDVTITEIYQGENDDND